MPRSLMLALLLSLVYLVVLGSTEPGDITMAVGLGGIIATINTLHRRKLEAVRVGRLLALPRFVVAVFSEIARGSFTMLRVAIGQKSWGHLGFVEAPVEDRSDRAVVVSGLVLTASPGTLLVEVDPKKQIMLIHAIDVSDPTRVRRNLRAFYQRSQRSLVP